MTETKRYRSPALRSLHEAVEDLHAVGAIDMTTKRRFDVKAASRRSKISALR